MNYEGGCKNSSDKIIGTRSDPIVDAQTLKANVGSNFVGNIVVEAKADVNSSTLTQTWTDESGAIVGSISWSNGVVTCLLGNDVVGYIPVTAGTSIGIARVDDRLYFSLNGLDAFFIGSVTRGTVNVELLTDGSLYDVRTGYSNEHSYNDLRDTMGYTGSIFPEDHWDTTIILGCESQDTLLPNKCPTSVCAKTGSCLQFRELPSSVSIANLECDMDLQACIYSLYVIEDKVFNNIHLLLVDSARGYVTEPINRSVVDSLFSEYTVGTGVVFKVVGTLDELEALTTERTEGTYPDMVVLDHTIPATPMFRFYRSIGGALATLAELPLDMPISLGEQYISPCQNGITNTYKGIDTGDNCVAVITNACTSGCSDWINHPSILEGAWSFSYRAQGDLTVIIGDNTASWITLTIDSTAHTLTVQKKGSTATYSSMINTPIAVGMLVGICMVQNVVSIYVEGMPYYRVIDDNAPPIMTIKSNPGHTVSNALVDPRLNGFMLAGWGGDAVYEDISNCGGEVDQKETIVVKDLHQECDTGKMYYRDIVATVGKGDAQTLFTMPNESYRASLDITIENRGMDAVTIDIYVSATKSVYDKDKIAWGHVIEPGLAYERLAQLIGRGENVTVRATGEVEVLIQTVEETI